jgi:hypothetical protein
MDLLNKLENVEIKITERFPPEDMEYCKQEERTYQEVYNICSEIVYIEKDANKKLSAISDNNYVWYIEDNKDKIISCNKLFIDKICGYFMKKYTVTINSPSWEIVDIEEERNKTKEKYDIVPLQYILDSIYDQMGGLSFEEKAFSELKEDAKNSLLTVSGKSKYRIQGKKLIIDDFYASSISYIGKRYTATVELKHRSFFKSLTHFEYKYYGISQKYGFLCEYQIDERNGVYDKHLISSTIINSIRVYKNGKIEIEFKHYSAILKFLEKYFPGIPQKKAA